MAKLAQTKKLDKTPAKSKFWQKTLAKTSIYQF